MPVARLEGVGGKGGAVQEGHEDEKEEGYKRETGGPCLQPGKAICHMP